MLSKWIKTTERTSDLFQEEGEYDNILPKIAKMLFGRLYTYIDSFDNADAFDIGI